MILHNNSNLAPLANILSAHFPFLRSIFASCDKDWQLRIYKTAGNKLIRQKVIQGMPGQWTITDHNLSIDNDWLIYSSITPYVYLTRTGTDASDEHHQLDFSHGGFQGGVRRDHKKRKGEERSDLRTDKPLPHWINRFGLCDSQEMEEKLSQEVMDGYMVPYEKGCYFEACCVRCFSLLSVFLAVF